MTKNQLLWNGALLFYIIKKTENPWSDCTKENCRERHPTLDQDRTGKKNRLKPWISGIFFFPGEFGCCSSISRPFPPRVTAIAVLLSSVSCTWGERQRETDIDTNAAAGSTKGLEPTASRSCVFTRLEHFSQFHCLKIRL